MHPQHRRVQTVPSEGTLIVAAPLVPFVTLEQLQMLARLLALCVPLEGLVALQVRMYVKYALPERMLAPARQSALTAPLGNTLDSWVEYV